jgi:signal transduction histidine kinase/DNA-binding response OmpR family regulator
MEPPSYTERARRVFLAPGALEDDSAFTSTLAGLANTGLQWGGLLGMTGVLILILVNWGLLGRPVSWWYPAANATAALVLWDKVLVLVVCGVAVVLGRSNCTLTVGRVAGAGLALGIAAVSLVHDAYRGVLSVEYLILVYLLVVAVVPYRPWQALLLGGGLTALFFGLGHMGVPGTGAAQPDFVTPGRLVRLGFTTIVLTGVSALLLSVRYQQHRARQTAEHLHEQVAALEQAKSRFFADVSHEFRTPLTLLLGSVREALDGRLGDVPPALHDRLGIMEGQARRMKRLVNQLLELATLDEGEMPLAMREHDLVALTERIVLPFRPWAEEEGLSFQVEVGPDSLNAWVDADRYEHILANLLSNAIKYTPEGGTVRVRIRREDDRAEIAVRDTGPGLPEHIRERIFDEEQSAIPVRPESADGETEGDGADQWIGMGIGLAHARALVRRHHGQLVVESEPGFGTELTVRLPLGTEHVADEDVAADEGAAGEDRTVDVALWRDPSGPATGEADTAPDDAARVLVVDDEAEMRGYLQSLLAPSYHVTTAATGAEALDYLRDDPPDLVISDVAMPEMDGIDLCRRIRADDRLRPLPVLLLTARQEAETRRSGIEAGADAYVPKPFDPAELEARIENLIEVRRIVQDRVRVPDWMEPTEASISSDEADFLERLNAVVDEHIDNSNFGVDWLADEMNLSARHLRRRLKEVTRLSPAGFIRTRRLQHAAALLEDGADTVKDVASAVGYRDPSYFSRLFRETFGCPPTAYAERDDAPDASDITA